MFWGFVFRLGLGCPWGQGWLLEGLDGRMRSSIGGRVGGFRLGCGCCGG